MKHVYRATIILTESCNLACTFCYEKSRTPLVMTTDTVKKVIDFILDNRQASPELFLFWFGGEPLLNFEVLKTGVAYANEKAAAAGIRVVHRVPTNGTLWNDEIERFFLENPDILMHISWQGLAEMQNADRGAAEIVEATAARIAARLTNPLDVQIQILPQYVGRLAEAVDHIVKTTNGRASIMLRPVPEMDGWADPAAVAELEEQVYACCKNHGRLIKRAAQCESGEIDSMTDCKAGSELCTFTPTGNIYVCHRFYFGQRGRDDRFKIGHVDTGFEDSELARKFEICKRDNIVGCAGCAAKRSCHTCYGCNYESTGHILKPTAENCAVNRAYGAALDRYLSEKGGREIMVTVPPELDLQKILIGQVLPLLVNLTNQIQAMNSRVAALEEQGKAALFNLGGGE